MVVKLPDMRWEAYRELLKRAEEKCSPGNYITPVILHDGVESGQIPPEEFESSLENPGIRKAVIGQNPLFGLRDPAFAGGWLEQLLRKRSPSVVLFPATETGKQTAAWLAGKAGLGLTADLTDFYMDDAGRLHQVRMAYGGSLQAEIVSSSAIQMATVKMKTEFSSIVVSGGMGAGKEGFLLLRKLAARLGGQLGATRAAVDAGYAPFACQIGQSGSYVRPAYYFAFGISGAVQHLAGMKDSKTVIAVNTDKKAPIFRYADYAVCGDVCEVADRMLRLL